MNTTNDRSREIPGLGMASCVLLVAGLGWLAGCGDDDGGPHPYDQANLVRGGQLYDNYWNVSNPSAAEPTGANPAYSNTTGTQTGTVTWRCKECHGWDYLGVAGRYGSGSHYTGVEGVLSAAAQPADTLFQSIYDGVAGSAMAAYGEQLSESDVWDLVKFVREGTMDLAAYIDEDTGDAIGGDPVAGETLYQATCALCHGTDGKALNFGDVAEPEYLGTVASDNPWEFQHKVRFGQPGESMPSLIEEGWTMEDIMDLLAHARTLPVI